MAPGPTTDGNATILADCLDSYFLRQNAIPFSRPPVNTSTALLDELPDVSVTVRGRALAEVGDDGDQ